jgi:hypothetical protein
MSASFAHEQSVYPFVHATVNLAIYMCTRNFAATVIAWYAWETIEKSLSKAVPSLAENCDDSLIGDPVIGLLSISSFFIADFALNYDSAFRKCAWPVARLFVFLAIGIASFFAPQLESTDFYWGIAVYTAIYIVAVVVGFGNVLFYNNANATASSRETRDARQSVTLWLFAVLAYAVTSIFVLDGALYLSSWMRVFYIAVGFVVISLYTLIDKRDS